MAYQREMEKRGKGSRGIAFAWRAYNRLGSPLEESPWEKGYRRAIQEVLAVEYPHLGTDWWKANPEKRGPEA